MFRLFKTFTTPRRMLRTVRKNFTKRSPILTRIKPRFTKFNLTITPKLIKPDINRHILLGVPLFTKTEFTNAAESTILFSPMFQFLILLVLFSYHMRLKQKYSRPDYQNNQSAEHYD